MKALAILIIITYSGVTQIEFDDFDICEREAKFVEGHRYIYRAFCISRFDLGREGR